jgi:hypothetical protein
VKRVEMEEILGEEIGKLIKKGDIQSIKEIKADEQSMKNIQDLQVKSTRKGIFMESIIELEVSDDGSRVWGIHITDYNSCKYQLLMEEFESGKSLLYNYEHQEMTDALIVAEDLNLVITGGEDKKIILHCLETGKTLKVLDLGVGRIPCFYRLGSVVAVAKDKEINFFDLVGKKKMDMLPVKVKCIVTCMQLSIIKSPEEKNSYQHILFVGGFNSTNLTKTILPQEISEKSNQDFSTFI